MSKVDIFMRNLKLYGKSIKGNQLIHDSANLSDFISMFQSEKIKLNNSNSAKN